MADILIIDDDEALTELLIEYGQRFSMTISACHTPLEGIDTLRSGAFDAVILDVMLPQMDGFEACRQIRQFSQVPIIMLTARGDVTDRIVGLELGADDYLPKPFEPRELMARLGAITKRQAKTEPGNTLDYDHLQIDLDTQSVRVDDKPITLTTREYALLILLAQSPGQTFSRDDLLSALKGADLDLFTRSIDILVSRLRHKLKPVNPIKTVHGAGYAFIGKRHA